MSADPDVQTEAALTANKLASVAVGFSIAAFLIAYLQLLFGNLMSGNALWKTNQAAIGVLARHRSWRPSLRRIKILYPKISLQPESLLQAARRSTHDQKQLLYPALSHDRPRATWAQVVQAFNITDPSTLVEAYLDSDTIPSSIDVPVQRVRLFDLARLALYLGCTKVKVDTEARYLRATGAVCTLKTEFISTFGNAVRFEGDLATLMHRGLDNHNAAAVLAADRICLGQFLLIGTYTGEIEIFRIHIDILYQFLDRRWSCTKYCEALQSSWPPQSIELERHIWSFADEIETLKTIEAFSLTLAPSPKLTITDTYHRHSVSAFESDSDKCGIFDTKDDCDQVSLADEHLTQMVYPKWQMTTGLTRPSPIISATLALIPSIFIGYPSKLFLHDLTSWCKIEAQHTLDLDENLIPERRVISLSEPAQQLAFDLKYTFCDQREHMPFLGKKPAYSWVASRLHDDYKDLPKPLRDSISSSRPQHPRTAYNVKALILPWTFELLKDYRPLDWAKRFQRRCRDTRKSHLHPCKILWTQLVLLDIVIRLQIKGKVQLLDGDGTELQDLDMGQDFTTSMIVDAPAIVAAITDSHRVGGVRLSGTSSVQDVDHKLDASVEPSYYSWDLHSSLVKHCSFYDDLGLEEAAVEYKRLAIMLKLRALFFIAFLLVGPNSSSVYEARGSQTQVPII